ncbi:MAG: BsuBI/PstI family type II restriction endonuclease [Leptospirales bacterium]
MNIIERLQNTDTFKSKPVKTQELILSILKFLEITGLPIDQTPRRVERMCLVFLACSDIKQTSDLKHPKTLSEGYSLKTRDVINFVNEHLGENISSGSYDDIRRKDLKFLVLSNIIVQSSPNSATNDSTRGYSLNPDYKKFVKMIGSKNWEKVLLKKIPKVQPLSELLARKRDLNRIPLILPDGQALSLSPGKHNQLQKLIVEDFLPVYGFGAEVLYVGDTDNKYLLVNQKSLDKLNLFEIAHDELPDVIAYSKKKNWLFFIEAVHSSGPISETRLLRLKKLSKKSKADIVFVTAFLGKSDFRKFIADIAWETEVWIADNPEHIIHFNGDKFLGPYSS